MPTSVFPDPEIVEVPPERIDIMRYVRVKPNEGSVTEYAFEFNGQTLGFVRQNELKGWAYWIFPGRGGTETNKPRVWNGSYPSRNDAAQRLTKAVKPGWKGCCP